MANTENLMALDRRIAIIRDNLRNLVEQASAFSGAADDSRTADRIAEQERILGELMEERGAVV